jgi:hypothetical protein
MKLPRSGHGRLSLEVIDLADFERPPMIGIPEYLEKRRGAGVGAPAVPATGGDEAIAAPADVATGKADE